MALNIVWVRIFWTSNIFVIIVFPYTHDIGAVTGTKPGVEFYTLPLIEINISAFLSFNTAQNPSHRTLFIDHFFVTEQKGKTHNLSNYPGWVHQNVKTAKIKVLHQKPFIGMGTK